MISKVVYLLNLFRGESGMRNASPVITEAPKEIPEIEGFVPARNIAS